MESFYSYFIKSISGGKAGIGNNCFFKLVNRKYFCEKFLSIILVFHEKLFKNEIFFHHVAVGEDTITVNLIFLQSLRLEFIL